MNAKVMIVRELVSEDFTEGLERAVNNVLSSLNGRLIDIKMSESTIDGDTYTTAMIVYEVDDGEN